VPIRPRGHGFPFLFSTAWSRLRLDLQKIRLWQQESSSKLIEKERMFNLKKEATARIGSFTGLSGSCLKKFGAALDCLSTAPRLFEALILNWGAGRMNMGCIYFMIGLHATHASSCRNLCIQCPQNLGMLNCRFKFSPESPFSVIEILLYKSGWERSQLTVGVPEVQPLSDFEYIPGFPQKGY